MKRQRQKQQQILAWLLTIILFIGIIPTKVTSAEVINNGTTVGSPKQKSIVRELVEKRQENAKFFLNSDGTETAVIYNAKVNYKNGDTYQRVSNNLIKPSQQYIDSGFNYKNEANGFDVYLKDNVTKDAPVQLEFEKYQVKLAPLGTNKEDAVIGTTYSSSKVAGQGGTISSNIEEKNKQLSVNIKDYINPVSTDSIEYKNVYGEGSKLQYQLINSGIKENIVLNNYNNINKFEFNLNLKGLKPEKKDNGPILLNDVATGEIKGVMPLPFMIDSAANEHLSENIQTYVETINEAEGYYKLIYIVDEEFLKSQDTVYPVTIDPSVVIQGAEYKTTRDAYVQSKYPGSNYWTEPQLRAGIDKSTGTVHSYVKFPNLPSLSNATITNAWFGAVGLNGNVATGNNATIEVRRPSSNWDSSNITWYNAPGFGGCIDSTAVSSPAWYYWNITNLVKDWYKGDGNYGLMLKEQNETWQYRRFSSSDGEYPPALIIDYINPVTTLKATAYGGQVNSQKGYADLSWSPVAGAKGYYVAILNGDKYEYFDVGSATNWTTKGKGIWPTNAEIIGNKRYQLHHDGTGEELPNDPVNCYIVSPGENIHKSEHFYSFKIVAYDEYKYEANIDTCNCAKVYIPDRVSPVGVQTADIKVNNSPALNEKNAWQLKVNWSSAKDLPETKKEDGSSLGSGIQKYKVQLIQVNNNSIVKDVDVTSNTTEYLFNNVTDNLEYKAAIYAYDNNGNYTIAPKFVGPIITGDRIPPTVPSSVSIDKAFTKGTLSDSPTISWTGITDEIGVRSIQYKIDDTGNWFDAGSNKGTDKIKIDFTSMLEGNQMREGNHKIYIRGVDKQGNIGESKFVQCIKDSLVPDIGFISPNQYDILSGLVSIKGWVNDVSIYSWNLEYGYGRNPLSFNRITSSDTNKLNGEIALWQVPGWMKGFYTLRLTAQDKVGNINVKSTIVEQADTFSFKPSIIINSPKNTDIINTISKDVNYSYENDLKNKALKAKLYINSKLYKEQNNATDVLKINSLDFKEGCSNDIYMEATDIAGNKYVSEKTYLDSSKISLSNITWESSRNLSLGKSITLSSMNENSGYAISKSMQKEDNIQFINIEEVSYKPKFTSIKYYISTGETTTWQEVQPNEKFYFPQICKTYRLKIELYLCEGFKTYYDNLNGNSNVTYLNYYPTLFEINMNVISKNKQVDLITFNFMEGDEDYFIGTNFAESNIYSGEFVLQAYEENGTILRPIKVDDVLQDNEGKPDVDPIGNGGVVIRGVPKKPTVPIKTRIPKRYYNHSGSMESNETDLRENVSSVKVIANAYCPTGTSVKYLMSIDSGQTWDNVNVNEEIKLKNPSKKVRLKAILTTQDNQKTPHIYMLKLAEVSHEDNIFTTNNFIVQLLKIPENLSVTPKVNYTTLLRWDYDTLEVVQGTRFNVYRSTEPTFTPAPGNRIASNIDTTYFNDYNINYDKVFYYKVTAVKDFPGQNGRESLCSSTAVAKVVSENELNKRLGVEDYWATSQFRTGAGEGFINLSSGNLCYESVDFVYPSPKLAMVLRRTYNNQAT